MSQARRRLRRITALVAEGHVFIVTKNGKPSGIIVAPEQAVEGKLESGHSDTSKSHE
ncbi:type II toxin-antitoxin system Phd/YefM family antitoxin [Pseudomonas promysalinigenes]|uniref:Type II toxin-antitoxin system Phd/YefM family antitoxin n=1 Tax=Pseudomonas promysalinigenes TaxID=485898 RepID=A0ABY6ARW7_9PSED|nr:type II toxin-antitoxin system Phd/YefM family antitoxin [Pseudomonas promysalinigenes]UXH42364.1 type II toxin-antitoxin system Phd/YefM family antitoxin [Pseudomonas promysalinigenes]